MDTSALLVGALIGLLIGLIVGLVVAARLVGRARAAELSAREREASLREQVAGLQAAAGTDRQMLDAFRSVSQEALAEQSANLVTVADAKYGQLHQLTDTVLGGHSRTIVNGLAVLGERLAALERERSESSTALRTVVGELAIANEATRVEAAKLASALRDNRVRGVWGEVQLRRALELAGLERRADFIEQRGVSDGDQRGRPDVVVPLANGRVVVIDSKVPLDRFLEAANAEDPAVERQLLAEHAKAVAGHVAALASRDYASMVDGSIDLVLMFLPGEPFLSAALDADPGLFEAAATRGVYLVTPTSLVPVLRGIAAGWREHRAEQSAAEIHQLGSELYERIAVFAGHHATVGAQLTKTIKAFNESVASLDSRVVSTARKLADRGAATQRELVEAAPVDLSVRASKLAGEVEGAIAIPVALPSEPDLGMLSP